MKTIKKSFIVVFCSIIVLFAGCFAIVRPSVASADVCESEELQQEVTDNDEITPWGLFTNLSISLNGGDSKVWATVVNEFTLFPSKVMVIVQLYASDTYEENYLNMHLMSQNSIMDLDIYNSIVAEASTNGKEMYWIGRVRYDIDGRGWQEKITGPARYSATGEFLGIL